MSKDEMSLRLDRLIGREVNVSGKIKYSSNSVEEYAGKTGTLQTYDLGIDDYEDPIALIKVISMIGKTKTITSEEKIWVDVRDIVEMQSKDSVG